MTDPVVDTDVHCLECEYNLTGVTSVRCPECGWVINYAVLETARDPTVAATQRSLLMALCGVVGLVPFGLLAFLMRSGAMPGWWKTLPASQLIAYTVTTAVCLILLLILGFHVIPQARVWPVHAPLFKIICRFAAAAHFLATGFLGLALLRCSEPMLAVGLLLASGIAWVLLLVSLVTLAAKGDALRHYLDEQARRGDRQDFGAPFVLHAAGRFSSEHVAVVSVDAIRETNPDIEAFIETVWIEKLRQAECSGRILYNGPVGRLVAIEVERARLILRVGATDYRDFVGTNLNNRYLVQRYGAQFRADPLGTSATVLTSDGHILYGRRGERVASHAGYLHTFGGMLEQEDKRSDNCYDVFSAVRRELREELHLTDEEIVDIVCTGLVRDAEVLQPELLFDAEVSLTRSEILERFDADTDEEHTAIEACLDEPEAIVPFVKCSAPIVPVALAAILLHGRANWGLDWYESTSYVLFGDLPKHEVECDNR